MRLPAPITSRTNAKVKALRAAFAGKASAPGESTAIEGGNLLSEAVRAGVDFEAFYVREGEEGTLDQLSLRALKAREHVVLSRDLFDSAVETVTPQGVAGIFPIPVPQRAEPREGGLVLLLENVQDPGNVGTLIRSAAAFGAAEVWLVGECANPWSPKVLRASAGAVFHVPVLRAALREAVDAQRPARRVFAAVPMRDGALSALQAQLQDGAVMIGSEGRGLSAEALALADELVTIPCRIESFNAAVAGSLLLYEAFRQSDYAQSATEAK